MICTFGDVTDVTWWRELQLPVRNVLGRDGRLIAEAPKEIRDAGTEELYAELSGKTAKQAQARIVELLRDHNVLDGDPRPITHQVKFYEKGDRPLEIVTTRQWYIRNGGRDEELRARLLELGRELEWHPTFMHQRYESWVEGLNGDWLISRQRYFGVPFPVWYAVDANGEPDFDTMILPGDDLLPVDPASDCPPGFTEAQRDQPGGFTADPDVMDTWATSSLTPQIVTGWCDDEDLFARTFPMSMRPQGPEIVRTWLFDTVVRAWFEHGALPWADTTINGWILDPDRKKMSKSVGNVITPMPLIEEHGSDAVRYWACNGRPGVDTALDFGVMKIGRKLAIKILNASKFSLTIAGDATDDASAITSALDQSMLTTLADLVDEATEAFEGFDYARALERTERFFWMFCDDYVELVKARGYSDDAASAQATLRTALSVLVRLFAPALPFVTEEVWSWFETGSVHRAAWPTSEPLRPAGADPLIYEVAAAVLTEVRKEKSEQKRSLATPVTHVLVRDTEERIAALRAAERDVRDAGKIAALDTEVGEFLVKVELAAPEDK